MNITDKTHLTFNTLDWYEYDEIIKEEDIENKENIKPIKQYIIKVFGKTKSGESVYLKIKNFTPHFYISYDQTWDDKKIKLFINHLKTLRQSLQNHLIEYDVVKRKNFYGFTDKPQLFIRLIFNNMSEMRECSKLFDKKMTIYKISTRPFEFKVFESNINPYLRFIHIKDLTSVGWISIDRKKLFLNEDDETTTKISFDVDWMDINPNNDPNLGIAPFKVCSFDIECLSMDKGFPQANRPEDTICQIGVTFNNYGDIKIYKRYLFNLDSCDPIPNCEVKQCKNEKELLIEFTEMIKKEDPDILTGYNIFGFDEKYIYDRCQLNKNRCFDEFSELSKILNINCKFVEKSLSSSALGDNIMRYFDTIGRLQIDLLKVVQRDYKLNSYKLDKVAEHFY